jgi:N-acetylneuraminate synthase
MADTGLPFLLSTGMSSLQEIDSLIEWIQSKNLPLILFQCTSAYPCPPEKIGINLIPFFRDRYKCAVGLSDHSGTVFPGLAAATLGIQALEVHVTLSREMFGPDVPASVTTTELRQLVEGVRFIEKMKAHPIDKNILAEELSPIRGLFSKSIVAQVDIPAGSIVEKEFLTLKKPGSGLPPSRLEKLVGKRALRDIAKDDLLNEEDFEWGED